MPEDAKFVVKNQETGSLCSSVGSEGWCGDVAAIMNRDYQTDRYRVVPWIPNQQNRSEGT